MWRLEQLGAGGPVYTLAWRLPLRGHLHEKALREAFAAIITRHEPLRTRFAEDDSGPVAVVEDAVELPLVVDDLRQLPAADRKARAARLCADDVNSGFALTCAPLMRARVLRLGYDQHDLLIVVHHIVFDVVSLDVLLDELGRAYSACVRGENPRLGVLTAHYADNVAEEQELITGPGRYALAAFWKKRLVGAPTVVLPPPDRDPELALGPGADRSWATRIYTRPLPEAVVTAVREFATLERTTSYSVYLAVLNILLYRLTGMTDIVVGSPMSARHRSAFERLVGFFVNIVVTRTDVNDQSFTELVRNVRESLFDALDHQRLPFEAVIDEVRPPRTSSYSPLCQVLFSLVGPILGPGVSFVDLEIGPIEQLHNGRSPFALTFSVLDLSQGGTALELTYAIALYDDTTAERMADQFIELLLAVMSTPDTAVQELAALLPPPAAPPPPASYAPAVPDNPTPPDAGEAVVRAVQAVWAMHLHAEVTDPDGDFVALGGHSLAAARIAVELQELFGLADGANNAGISELTLFRAPTPRLLAAHLANELGGWPAAAAEAEFVLRLLAMTDEQAREELTRVRPGESP
jgi:hypothetical protein